MPKLIPGLPTGRIILVTSSVEGAPTGGVREAGRTGGGPGELGPNPVAGGKRKSFPSSRCGARGRVSQTRTRAVSGLRRRILRSLPAPSRPFPVAICRGKRGPRPYKAGSPAANAAVERRQAQRSRSQSRPRRTPSCGKPRRKARHLRAPVGAPLPLVWGNERRGQPPAPHEEEGPAKHWLFDK
jgi:hypothetical protein